MNELLIDKAGLQFEGKVVPFENLFSPEFYPVSDRESIRFKCDFFCVNELFAHLSQPYLALEYFISNNDVDIIDVRKADGEYKLYAIDIARKRSIPTKGCASLEKFSIAFNAFFIRLASCLYLSRLMFKIPYSSESIEAHSRFAVLRTKSAIQKFKPFTDLHKEFEIIDQKETIYRYFSKWERVGWVWKAYFKSFSYLRRFKEFYKPLTGKYSIAQIDVFYQKRIVHALLYEQLMREYMSHFKGCTFYTGNNLDRFSVIEENLAKEYGIKTVCYPHGLEYGYKFPKGFSCDLFYANSEFAAKELNRVYETDKFIYDENITKKMFELKGVPEHPKHVVFFTEQQEYHVNKAILTELQPLLAKEGIDVLVKLHPGDTKDHYTDCNFKYITDYGESLTGNICVSRKSTVLLEAVYNNSTAIAIITTQKDKSVFDTFPSLQSEDIIKTYNVPDLYKEIIKHIKR